MSSTRWAASILLALIAGVKFGSLVDADTLNSYERALSLVFSVGEVTVALSMAWYPRHRIPALGCVGLGFVMGLVPLIQSLVLDSSKAGPCGCLGAIPAPVGVRLAIGGLFVVLGGLSISYSPRNTGHELSQCA
jgi:hypothetical protein